MALYDFLDGPPAPLNSQLMEKVNHYNLTKKMNFSMGPSVKFVLAIIDSISEIWSVLGISTAIKTALKVAPTGSSKWSINGKVKHYN